MPRIAKVFQKLRRVCAEGTSLLPDLSLVIAAMAFDWRCHRAMTLAIPIFFALLHTLRRWARLHLPILATTPVRRLQPARDNVLKGSRQWGFCIHRPTLACKDLMCNIHGSMRHENPTANMIGGHSRDRTTSLHGVVGNLMST